MQRLVGVYGTLPMCIFCYHEKRLSDYPEFVIVVGAFKYEDGWILVSEAKYENNKWHATFNNGQRREYKTLDDYYKVHGGHIKFIVTKSDRRKEYENSSK